MMFIRKIHKNLESTCEKILWWSMMTLNFSVLFMSLAFAIESEPKQYEQKTTNTGLHTKEPVKEYTK